MASGEYGALFEANRRLFEKKWGVVWEPHQRRFDPEYSELTERITRATQSVVPPGAHVLVVSKGDPRFLELGDRRAWHFPCGDDGEFRGYYPVDGVEAITHLEDLRGRGAQYLVFPRTAFWWLEHYHELHSHLTSRGNLVWRTEDCAIFDLSRRARPLDRDAAMSQSADPL